MVDSGPFPSAKDAAHAETQIDWSGDHHEQMRACTQSFAAEELRHTLCKLSGESDDSMYVITEPETPLPEKTIVLATLEQTGDHPELSKWIQQDNLSEELTAAGSFSLIPRDNRLFIIGADRAGTLYGAYQLLEHLGVRWYAPGETGTIIPRSASLTIPAKTEIATPDYITRGFWAWEDRGNTGFYLWMARNKMNYWTIAEPNRAFLHKLGMHLTFGGHKHFHRYMNPDGEYPYNHPQFRGDDNKPADPYTVSTAEYRGDVNGDGRLTYFEAHPEWYGLIDGQRTPFKEAFGTNICTSNEEAITHLCNGIVNELAVGEWRDAASLNFWPIDGGEWCECDNCAPLGNPTDRLLRLVYQLQQAVESAREDGRIQRPVNIVFPIYLETLVPPSRPLPDGFDYNTCIGTFFPIHRCYGHFIDDPACTEYNVDHWQTFLDWTQGEPRYYQGQFFVGEYFNVSKIKSLPVLYTRILSHDIPAYYHQGARHCHYMHVNTRLWGMKRLNNFLFARLMWNTETDVNRSLERYFTHVYGPVADDMRQLYDHLEIALSNVKQIRDWEHLPDRINADLDPLFHRDHLQLEETHPEINDGVDLAQSVAAMKTCRALLDTVLSQELSPLLRMRLLEDDKNLRYGEHTIHFYDAVIRAILAEREGDLARARSEFRRSLPHARALKAETEILQTASSHANSKNGLTATAIEETYMQMGQRLLPDFSL
jgi:hypothetical protein